MMGVPGKHIFVKQSALLAHAICNLNRSKLLFGAICIDTKNGHDKIDDFFHGSPHIGPS